MKLSFITSLFLMAHIAGNAQQMVDYTKQVFPSNHALNVAIDTLPVHSNSDNYVASIGAGTHLHPDFGTEWDDNGTIYQIGIPYNIVHGNAPAKPIGFEYADESDAGPWPVPDNPLLETVANWRETTEGDRHMLIIDTDNELLYESWNTYGNNDGTAWEAGSGAVFDLKTNNLRPDTWTSADAAGLPIFPLLIRYDELENAVANETEIPHAIRFTVVHSQRAYVWPARHFASSNTDENLPPMGLRFRLKSDFDISGYSPKLQVIMRTMKKYGIIVSDNGSNWYIQGTHDDRWDDDELSDLRNLQGSDFEAVDISSWLNHPDFDANSGAVPGVEAIENPSLVEKQSHIKAYTYYDNDNYYLACIVNSMVNVKISVFNALGEKVYGMEVCLNAGKNVIPLINDDVPFGIYYLDLKGDNVNDVLKIYIK